MATKLSELGIDEVSGVENPANEIPDWIVVKSADGNIDIEASIKKADRAETDFALLFTSLQAVDEYLGEAPQEVQDAAATLKAYVEEMFGDEGEDETAEPAPEEAAEPVALSADDKPKSLVERYFGKGKKDKQETTTTKEKADVSEETKTEKTETEKTEKTEGEVEKTAEVDVEAITKSVTDAVGEQLKPIQEGQDALAEALSKTLDRVGSLEAQQQGFVPDPDPTPATKSESPRGQDALRGFMKHVTSHPNSSVRLG